MKIPKIKISEQFKSLLVSSIEGALIIVLLIGLVIAATYKEASIVKTEGNVSRLELAMDEPPSPLYARVYLKNASDAQFKTDLKTAQTLLLAHRYVFFTKNNVIIYYTESK